MERKDDRIHAFQIWDLHRHKITVLNAPIGSMNDDDDPIWVNALVEDAGMEIYIYIKRSQSIKKLKKIAIKEIKKIKWKDSLWKKDLEKKEIVITGVYKETNRNSKSFKDNKNLTFYHITEDTPLVLSV